PPPSTQPSSSSPLVPCQNVRVASKNTLVELIPKSSSSPAASVGSNGSSTSCTPALTSGPNAQPDPFVLPAVDVVPFMLVNQYVNAYPARRYGASGIPCRTAWSRRHVAIAVTGNRSRSTVSSAGPPCGGGSCALPTACQKPASTPTDTRP